MPLNLCWDEYQLWQRSQKNIWSKEDKAFRAGWEKALDAVLRMARDENDYRRIIIELRG